MGDAVNPPRNYNLLFDCLSRKKNPPLHMTLAPMIIFISNRFIYMEIFENNHFGDRMGGFCAGWGTGGYFFFGSSGGAKVQGRCMVDGLCSMAVLMT